MIKNRCIYWYLSRDINVRDAGVAGSNPATPTMISKAYSFCSRLAQ
jgi:hypothetical protein